MLQTDLTRLTCCCLPRLLHATPLFSLRSTPLVRFPHRSSSSFYASEASFPSASFYLNPLTSSTMARPSEDWSGFADLSPESDKYKRIKLVLSSANFKHLKKYAINSRRRHRINLPPDIGCSINLTQFATGFNNLVLELTFSDKIYLLDCSDSVSHYRQDLVAERDSHNEHRPPTHRYTHNTPYF